MRLRSSNKIDAGFSLSSMTDLVFLLLIFFVIISTMISPTTMPVDLPVSANKTKEKPRVGVRIDADGAFSVNDKPVEPLELERVLQERMATIQEQNPSLVIHVDQRVPAGVTVGVMDIAKRNNWKIIIATRPK
ncbi:MAG TPA: biopolymer transporter ExbD [Flavobacteriales bacterium]|nr:biopolymer transporter ExbD [Flavobacteriales bacterium]